MYLMGGVGVKRKQGTIQVLLHTKVGVFDK